MKMDISKLSDKGLLSLYNAITKALDEDDNIPEEENKKYGVRDFLDWQIWGNSLEAEIKKRDLEYTPIPW
jgi:hypothetical protein